MKALVILVNRARPDFLGCYGCDWLSTPAFDRLASEGIVFDQHFSDCPRPRAARRVWRWGSFGHASNVALHAGLPLVLWDQGVKTCLIADERSPSFNHSFASGWQMLHWVRAQDLETLAQEHLLAGSIQLAVDWIGEHGKDDNWLLWLELSSLQPPWDQAESRAEAGSADVAQSESEELQGQYAGMMRGLDDWLGQLLDLLREKGLYDDLMIVLTSDCGLPLGDREDAGPASLNEEMVHLPLILRLPGGAEAGRRVHQLTQPVDLLPTLADAFGVPAEELNGDNETGALPGWSLLPLTRGEPAKTREYACACTKTEWSIRTHHWHLLLPITCTPPLTKGGQGGSQQPRLYIKPDDRWEVSDVLSQHVDVAEHLELTLRRYMAANGGELPHLREEVLKL